MQGAGRGNETRRTFLKKVGVAATSGSALSALTGCASQGPRKNRGSKRPNVILIITDDQGFGDLGVKGNPLLKTPNIDAMARRSAEMESFYVSPVCAPTRACLMTGRYNYRTRCIDTYIGRAMMDPEEVTVAELLNRAGYATGIFGKWHLGDNYPMRPMEQGFEEALVHKGGGIGQPPDPPGGEGKYTDPVLFHNGELKPMKGYCTDIYFDHAMEWMEKCSEAGRNFFAYIPTNAPHGPFNDVPEELFEMYKGMNLDNIRFPQYKGHPLPEKVNQDLRARIFAMITNIDRNVGRLFERLDALDLTRDTLVIFMVDNGPNTRRYVAGMRGKKSDVYEGGIRSPFYMHWPARLEAGRSSDRVAAHIDVLPTLLGACGVPLPENREIDGRNFLPLLTGEQTHWPDRTLFIQSHRGDVPVPYHHFAARSQQWKLLHASGFGRERFEGEPKFELYNMEEDPLEMRDLAAERPDMVKKMKARYDAWFKDVGSTRPDNYAPPRIHIGTPHENPVVLTRQDWRHVKGSPWGKESNGYWELYNARPGSFNIRLRFSKVKTAGEATLQVGPHTITQPFEQGAKECLFKGLQLDKGPLRLQGEMKLEEVVKGPHKVDVIQRGAGR